MVAGHEGREHQGGVTIGPSAPSDQARADDPANMRENGVRSLAVSRRASD
jgi:hypothetical protein